MGIRIAGVGSYAPDKILTNHDLEKMVDTSDEWIVTRTGIRERHIAAPDEPCSALAVQAAKKALAAAKINPEELDFILLATCTPDHCFPSTACIVQGQIGAKNAACLDLEAACSGLIYGLEVASGLLNSNPRYKKILVIGSDKISSIVDWQDRNTCVLFGDGAGALVLEKDASDEPLIVASELGADGTFTDILNVPAGGSVMPPSAETVEKRLHYIKMNGQETFKQAVPAMVNSCRNVLTEAGVSEDQVAWLVPHQANYRILTAVASRLKIPEERVWVNIDRYSNTSAATIGICLDEMVREGKVKNGDYVLLTAFGGGLTWGSALLRWNH